MILNIVIVWYNEELNIPKMFKHLEYLRSKIKCRIIYVDQESTDKSAELMEKWWAEVYIHPNKWYADPDKKWAVEELCWNDEWCFILDCDEEITKDLADKIYKIIKLNPRYTCYSIIRSTYLLWVNIVKTKQLRLFKKDSAELSLEVHNYINPSSNAEHIILKEKLNEIDLKLEWKWIYYTINKNNNYSNKELEKIQDISKAKCIFFMLRKPILRFFWFWIMYRNFFKWTVWFINCCLMSQYQFWIYAKLYERLKLKDFKTHKK